MKRKLWKRLGVSLGMAVCVVFLSPGFLQAEGREDNEIDPGIEVIQLTTPAFALKGQLAGTNFLQEQAGISAFVNVGREIDLTRARGAFRTIERETDEYLIGSVAIAEKDEGWDVHVFVQREGWIIAYYHRDRSTGWIINWDNPEVTHLESAIGTVAAEVGSPLPKVNFYDFRFPRAERLRIILDRDSFRMMIPKELAVYDRAFSFLVVAAGWRGSGSLSISGDEIASLSRIPARQSRITVDDIAPVKLKPDDVMRTIRMVTEGATARAAIILTYREN